MLSKFETKSNRVKGLSFHNKRPWILASLHNGCIQLWDYKMGTLIDKFEEHEGPVRGISFHLSQPLFVSGGDDYKIKLWNWKQRRCLFTFNGHLDYIRTVFFHNESPWIISASDDQTIRIWNWQSRNCISILTGHNHYVMCAQFHPKDDLVVSASMDQTVRVWDISGLRRKHAAGAPPVEDTSRSLGGQPDVFGNTDAVVKYVLEGHTRGVNWVAFHPTMPLIVSGGDDRLVKLWRMNETRAWEVDTCRGHYNQVSCVLFHPRQEVILSNAEDTTIRLWDMNKRTALQTYRREGNRFWTIVAHPELNLFAAGHDGGLIVFKLERERPAYAIHQDTLIYVREKYIRTFQFGNASDVPVMTIRRGQVGQAPPPRSLSYNPAEHAILLTSPAEGGYNEMYALPRDMSGLDVRENLDARRSPGGSAFFVARNRTAVLDKGQILIKDLSGTVTKQFKAPANVTDVYHAGGKTLLYVSSSSVTLFDIEIKETIAELMTNNVRYVVWNNDQSLVALLAKHAIVVANRKLEQVWTLHETIRIKSAAWDDTGILIYSTLNHLKYALPNGDNGIICTLEHPMYVIRIKGNVIFCLDREAKVQQIKFDPTEYQFKLALIQRNYDQVFHIIRTSNLVGQAIVSYLQKKGYPEIALQFVKDPKTRFDLAIECGNIEVALEMAKKIELDEYWHKLGLEALRQGNHQVVEFVYQRVKNFDRLSFLYLITGNVDKLRKMLKIAELRGDTMSRYHNALFLGDVEDQVKMLREAGQLQLAYLCAQTHGLVEEAQSILAEAGLEHAPSTLPNAQLLRAPTPILRQFETNWPRLAAPKGFGGPSTNGHVLESPVSAQPTKSNGLTNGHAGDSFGDDTAGWGDDDLDVPDVLGDNARPKTSGISGLEAGVNDLDLEDDAAGWDLDAELDLELESPQPVSGGIGGVDGQTASYIPPVAGVNIAEHWVRNSGLAVDHIAAGAFESAMQLLNRQAGIVNFAPLKPHFLALYAASSAFVPATAGAPSIQVPLLRNPGAELRDSLPLVTYKLAPLVEAIQEAYGHMTRGRFGEATQLFQQTLQRAAVTAVEKASEVDEVQQVISICREYLLGLRLELTRKEISDDPKRSLELASYFTHCQLQPIHMQLCLQSAMLLSFKANNLGLALSFSRRLLELGPSAAIAAKAKKVIQHCERSPTNELTVEYDERNPFVTCAMSMSPIYRGNPSIQCPFCKVHYKPDFQGQLCAICDLGQVGGSATGLQNLVSEKKF